MISNSQLFLVYVKARKACQNHDYRSVITDLRPLDDRVANSDVNHLLVKALFFTRRYSEAKVRLLKLINTYTRNFKLASLMIEILLKNHDFVLVREIVITFKDESFRQQLFTRLQNAEARFVANDRRSLVRLTSRFYHLAKNSLLRQRQVFKASFRLPVGQFVRVARELLVDPFLRPLMRVSILNVFRKLRLRLTVRFRWLDRRVHLVDVNSLVALTSSRVYRRLMNVVDQCRTKDPVKILTLKQNLRLGLVYLYPFGDRVVTDPKLWVRVASLRMRNFQPEFQDSTAQRIYAWQVKLSRLTRNLTR